MDVPSGMPDEDLKAKLTQLGITERDWMDATLEQKLTTLDLVAKFKQRLEPPAPTGAAGPSAPPLTEMGGMAGDLPAPGSLGKRDEDTLSIQEASKVALSLLAKLKDHITEKVRQAKQVAEDPSSIQDVPTLEALGVTWDRSDCAFKASMFKGRKKIQCASKAYPRYLNPDCIFAALKLALHMKCNLADELGVCTFLHVNDIDAMLEPMTLGMTQQTGAGDLVGDSFSMASSRPAAGDKSPLPKLVIEDVNQELTGQDAHRVAHTLLTILRRIKAAQDALTPTVVGGVVGKKLEPVGIAWYPQHLAFVPQFLTVQREMHYKHPIKPHDLSVAGLIDALSRAIVERNMLAAELKYESRVNPEAAKAVEATFMRMMAQKHAAAPVAKTTIKTTKEEELTDEEWHGDEETAGRKRPRPKHLRDTTGSGGQGGSLAASLAKKKKTKAMTLQVMTQQQRDGLASIDEGDLLAESLLIQLRRWLRATGESKKGQFGLYWQRGVKGFSTAFRMGDKLTTSDPQSPPDLSEINIRIALKNAILERNILAQGLPNKSFIHPDCVDQLSGAVEVTREQFLLREMNASMGISDVSGTSNPPSPAMPALMQPSQKAAAKTRTSSRMPRSTTRHATVMLNAVMAHYQENFHPHDPLRIHWDPTSQGYLVGPVDDPENEALLFTPNDDGDKSSLEEALIDALRAAGAPAGLLDIFHNGVLDDLLAEPVAVKEEEEGGRRGRVKKHTPATGSRGKYGAGTTSVHVPVMAGRDYNSHASASATAAAASRSSNAPVPAPSHDRAYWSQDYELTLTETIRHANVLLDQLRYTNDMPKKSLPQRSTGVGGGAIPGLGIYWSRNESAYKTVFFRSGKHYWGKTLYVRPPSPKALLEALEVAVDCRNELARNVGIDHCISFEICEKYGVPPDPFKMQQRNRMRAKPKAKDKDKDTPAIIVPSAAKKRAAAKAEKAKEPEEEELKEAKGEHTTVAQGFLLQMRIALRLERPNARSNLGIFWRPDEGFVTAFKVDDKEAVGNTYPPKKPITIRSLRKALRESIDERNRLAESVQSSSRLNPAVVEQLSSDTQDLGKGASIKHIPLLKVCLDPSSGTSADGESADGSTMKTEDDSLTLSALRLLEEVRGEWKRHLKAQMAPTADAAALPPTPHVPLGVDWDVKELSFVVDGHHKPHSAAALLGAQPSDRPTHPLIKPPTLTKEGVQAALREALRAKHVPEHIFERALEAYKKRWGSQESPSGGIAAAPAGPAAGAGTAGGSPGSRREGNGASSDATQVGDMMGGMHAGSDTITVKQEMPDNVQQDPSVMPMPGPGQPQPPAVFHHPPPPFYPPHFHSGAPPPMPFQTLYQTAPPPGIHSPAHAFAAAAAAGYAPVPAWPPPFGAGGAAMGYPSRMPHMPPIKMEGFVAPGAPPSSTTQGQQM